MNRRDFFRLNGLVMANLALATATGMVSWPKPRRRYAYEITYTVNGYSWAEFAHDQSLWEDADYINKINDHFFKSGLLLKKNSSEKRVESTLQITWAYEFVSEEAAKLWEKTIHNKHFYIWKFKRWDDLKISSRQYPVWRMA